MEIEKQSSPVFSKNGICSIILILNESALAFVETDNSHVCYHIPISETQVCQTLTWNSK